MSGTEPIVEIGFVIVKPNGSPWDEYLYPSREAAERIAGLIDPILTVWPSRRIRSVRKANEMEIRGWTDLIIDRGGE
ncbi:MAG: hypothetical protein KDK08_18305 [Rhizobiaceae bacterium]|nr:hypothetical protein [Rhizobiaceae bacterium]